MYEQGNLNLRAAYIPVLGDLIQSIGVCLAGIAIWIKPSWQIVDPICTFLFAVLVLYTTIQILQQSIQVLLETVPKNVDIAGIKRDLESLEDVKEVHDLHVWSLTTGAALCTAHIAVGEFLP